MNTLKLTPYEMAISIRAKYYTGREVSAYEVRHVLSLLMLEVQESAALASKIKELHKDGGRSQGYLQDGSYGEIEHACNVCGTFGEYGEPWPCPTYTLADRIKPVISEERE